MYGEPTMLVELDIDQEKSSIWPQEQRDKKHKCKLCNRVLHEKR